MVLLFLLQESTSDYVIKNIKAFFKFVIIKVVIFDKDVIHI